MNKGEIIKSVVLKKGDNTIEFDRIYPIEKLSIEAKYLINESEQTEFFGVYYADTLVIESSKEQSIDIILGEGYLASKAFDWESKFLTEDIWLGGDGIFSFNLEDGLDCFDQEQYKKTLFVFGDTFVGTYDSKTKKRLQPHLMPNNSFAYLNQKSIEFLVNRGDYGNIKGFFEMDEDLDFSGSVPANLIRYDRLEENIGWLSGFNPKNCQLIFDLHRTRHVTSIEVFNYYSEEMNYLSKRGVKDLVLFGSNDCGDWNDLGYFSLVEADRKNHSQRLELDDSFRYYKFILKSNHNDQNFKEGLFGLSLVKFYCQDFLYRDITVKANSILTLERDHSWIWLQDGVVIDNYLYFFPLVVNSDLNQPEGLQFCVKGVSLFKVPIIDKEVDYRNRTQKMAPLLLDYQGSQYLFGCAIYANTNSSGATNGDGYIYVYGYKTTYGMRELILARVKPKDFEFFDDWEFFNGKGFVKDILEVKPLLEHVSCEMSVSKILLGKFKDKYLAVFTYDTNTPYIAIALSDNLTGPFSKPQIIYKTTEQEEFKSTTYTYNAKAHPHLSMSEKVLVSYNTNTYNFEHNMSNRMIYNPRFIYLLMT